VSKVPGNDLVIFDTIESITSRPNYIETIDIKNSRDDRFAGVVGPYRITGEKILCGIHSCRTPNLNGVVIRLKDGSETNVGRDCGGAHFDAEFKIEVRRHDALYNRHLKLKRIIEIQSEPQLLERLKALKFQYDALKAKRLELRGRISRGQSDRLFRMGKERDGRVYRHEFLSGDELEAYYETNQGERKSGARPSKAILLGEIQGVEFMADVRRDEDPLNLTGLLEQIYESNYEAVSEWKEREINFAHRTVNNLPKQLDRIEHLIRQGTLFFDKDNLDRLRLIGVDI